MFWHGIAQYAKTFILVQGSRGTAVEDLELFLLSEYPHMFDRTGGSDAARQLFTFFQTYQGVVEREGKLYVPPEIVSDLLGTRRTRLSQDGEAVFQAVAASFSHGIIATDICTRTGLDNKQVSRFVKLLVESKLAYSMAVTLTGPIKEYWGANVSNIVWAEMFIKGRSDEELKAAFNEYTQSRSDYLTKVQRIEEQKPLTAKQVCDHLGTKRAEQTYNALLEHFISVQGASTAKARKLVNTQMDTLVTALDRSGVIGSYMSVDGSVAFSRQLTAQGIEARTLCATRRESKTFQATFHLGPVCPVSGGPNFLFLVAAQTLTSARQALPSITHLPLAGMGAAEVSCLQPLTCNGRSVLLLDLIGFLIFQAGEDGLQLSGLKDKHGLTRKTMEWVAESILSSYPVVKADEAGTFRYWHFPYGPRILYSSCLGTSSDPKKAKAAALFQQKVKRSCVSIGRLIQLRDSDTASAPVDFISAPCVQPPSNPAPAITSVQTVDPLVLSHVKSPEVSTPLRDVFGESNALVMTSLGCFLCHSLELAFVRYDLRKNIAISARAQLILSFFRHTGLYTQQDLLQLMSLLPTELSAAFPLCYGFTELSPKRMDRKTVQRSLAHLVKGGFLIETRVTVGSRDCTVYYRPDIFVLSALPSGQQQVSNLLQDRPDLLEIMSTYVSSLPSFTACDDATDSNTLRLSDSLETDSCTDESSPSWAVPHIPSLEAYKVEAVDMTTLNKCCEPGDQAGSAAKVDVLDRTVYTETNVQIFQRACTAINRAMTAIRASIVQSRRKYNLRRAMLMHLVFLQASRRSGLSYVSDLAFCEHLTFVEYMYLFPLPESAPIYQFFLSYLLTHPDTPIGAVTNPALYLFTTTTLFVSRMGKYRDWLSYLDILHCQLEESSGRVANYFHEAVTHLPPLELSNVDATPSLLSNILIAIHSSLNVSGIRAVIQLSEETNVVTITLLEPIIVQTDEDVLTFWSLLEDICIRIHLALKFLSEHLSVNLTSVCNELGVYSMMRSWVFNADTRLFIQKRLRGAREKSTVTAQMRQFILRAQEAATSLCDTLGQQGTVVHINAFVTAIQKEVVNFYEAEGCALAGDGKVLPLANLVIVDYGRLADAAVSLLPEKYISFHFDGSIEGARQYYEASRQSTLDFLLYAMRISTIAVAEQDQGARVGDTEIADTGYRADKLALYIPTAGIQYSTEKHALCSPYSTMVSASTQRVYLNQAIASRASAPISYWTDKILHAIRPRGGRLTSVSTNMRIADSQLAEYCSISIFTNNPWLLALSTDPLTMEQLDAIPQFMKSSNRVRRMRSARGSTLTNALKRHRQRQQQELQFREELAFIFSEGGTIEEGTKGAYEHLTVLTRDCLQDMSQPLTKNDITAMIAQYKESKVYLHALSEDITLVEHMAMQYASLFRTALPLLKGDAEVAEVHVSRDSTDTHSNKYSATDFIVAYITNNSAREDLVAYGKVYPMAVLTLLSPEIDLLFNLPTASSRTLLLKMCSDDVSSTAKMTYRERKVKKALETIRLATLMFLLTRNTRESICRTLQSKLLITKEQVVHHIDPASLKLAFSLDCELDADDITSVYERRLPGAPEANLHFTDMCNIISRMASLQLENDARVIEWNLPKLVQYILSAMLVHRTNPVLNCTTAQGSISICYSTHKMLLRRMEHMQQETLARGGDAVQSLLDFLCLPPLIHDLAFLSGWSSIFEEVDLSYLQLVIKEARNASIARQHAWAGAIKSIMGSNAQVYRPGEVSISVTNVGKGPTSEQPSQNDFPLQYILASGYARPQGASAAGWAATTMLQKTPLAFLDNRRNYLADLDIESMGAYNAFLLIPSIIFGVYRGQYYMTGSSIDTLSIDKTHPLIKANLCEDDHSLDPVDDILKTYSGYNDIVSAMLGDVIHAITDGKAQVDAAPQIIVIDGAQEYAYCSSVKFLLEEYARDRLCLTPFNYPEHADTLIHSGLFAPRSLVTEKVFIPLLAIYGDSDQSQQYALTEFGTCATTKDGSGPTTEFNDAELELALRQVMILLSTRPGITLESLCTACVPLMPMTVCKLVNVLIWDGTIEARILHTLAGGKTVQRQIEDMLIIEVVDFARVFLSANFEHLANRSYNSTL